MLLWSKSSTNPVNSSQVSWEFEASVSADQYLYTAKESTGPEFVFGSNGTDSYCLIRDPEGKERIKMPGYVGYVFNGQYPAPSFHRATALPWLAYCSGVSMKSSATTNKFLNLPAPWLCSWAMLWAHLYKVRYIPLEHGYGLPKRLEYIIDSDKREPIKNGFFETLAKPSDSDRDAIVLKLASLEHYSEPEAVYNVTKTTNFNGVVLPLTFSFDRYAIGGPSSRGIKRELVSKLEGELTSLVAIDTVNPLPVNPDGNKNILVSDYRFANTTNGVVFLNYSTSAAGNWITNKADPLLQRLYSEDIALRRGLMPVNAPKYVVVVFLVIVGSVPLLWLIYQARMRRKKQLGF